MLENQPYTPAKYGKAFYGVTGTTVINWIRANKMPDNTKVEKTPGGTYKIWVNSTPKSNADKLVQMMKLKAG